MFSSRIRTAVRQQWAGLIALFIALSGGVAWASHPGGQNTINSADIINGEVKSADVGQAAVATDELKNDGVKTAKIANGEVRSADVLNNGLTADDLASGSVASAEVKDATIANGDVAPNSLTSGRILDGTLTGADVANNSLKGADVDESTLDIGDTARAYARGNPFGCTGTPGTCTPEQSKGISSVTHDATGIYCVTAPGIDAGEVAAAVTVDWSTTVDPQGNASAMTNEGGGCGPTGDGFVVRTERQPTITVDANGGTNNETASGPANFADDVGFTIVIP
jgi:hypothetical protein